MSRLTQARGLKRARAAWSGAERSSRLTQARGLKHVALQAEEDDRVSRLTQARGLKQLAEVGDRINTMSRLTQARGLKLCLGVDRLSGVWVAPHAGAWIETRRYYALRCGDLRRASRRRVD